MRSLKSTGGSPEEAEWPNIMQGFTCQTCPTSEQHKEATVSRINRDHANLGKIVEKL